MTEQQFPKYRGKLEYVCIGCGSAYPASELYYSCPKCKGVLLLKNRDFSSLKRTSGKEWQEIFDARQTSRLYALRGIFRFYELLAPIMDEEDIVWLGEGNTPLVPATRRLQEKTGIQFSFKNDGQNPSASFKDRGMACAFSYLKWICRKNNWDEVLTICASTGDTSAAAALYAAYVGPPLKSVVLLPKGKVTPQQLAQPLGSGATVLEIPGVFDDCMKIVEFLADHYKVALLNSKNSWRILGQESWAFEIAQWHGWNTEKLCVFVPIGNAGNITAIMNGFLKMLELDIITALPRIFGVQSSHADPVYQYFHEAREKRRWQPVKVKPSVAQAAMIGNPVSFPRVKYLAEKYMDIAGDQAFNVLQVSEQEIIESMLEANRHGHIACTQGGECFAGLKKALSLKLIKNDETTILDSTAHILKFIDFQNKYFSDTYEKAYEIIPKQAYRNLPVAILENIDPSQYPVEAFAQLGAETVAKTLNLQKNSQI